MKIRAQDLRPGMRVWSGTVPRFIIVINSVKVMEGKRFGRHELPGVVAVTMSSNAFPGAERGHSFKIDEELEQALIT